MKISKILLLALSLLTVLPQQSNAFDLQSIKTFLSSSATKVIQSISNNKQAYAIGAAAIGATFGLGWYFVKKYTQTKLSKDLEEIISKFKSVGKAGELRKNLMKIKTLIDESKLETALNDLEKIKKDLRSDYIFNQTQFSVDENGITGQQVIEIYLTEFTKQLKSQIQETQLHIAGQPYGLVNNTNSCFMNAAIQCLYSLDTFNEILFKYIDCYNKGSIAESYIQLLKAIQKEQYAVINPLAFCKAGWKLMGAGEKTQHDSEEFVQRLVDGLIDENVNRARLPEGKIKELENLSKVKVTEYYYNSQDKIEEVKEAESSCCLYIPIGKSHKTLSDCLRGYFDKEILLDNRFKKRRMALDAVSNYLFIRLRRTGFNQSLGQPFKIEQPILFDLDNVNIDALSLGSKQFPLYDCKAFIAHAGNPGSGHYISFVRMNNRWYLCDDTKIFQVSQQFMHEFAINGNLYKDGKIFTPVMFFYEQKS